MPSPFTTTRRVEFADTDMAGIAHFTAFFRYLEQAEHELLRHVGLGVSMPEGDGHVSWPRVSASCDYRNPAKFDELLTIEVRVARVGEKSVTYLFTVRRDETLIAEGRMTSVCCQVVPGTTPTPIPIPDWIRKKLPEPEPDLLEYEE